MSKLLLDDYPLIILPRLAVIIGLNEAIVLQQVHYWCQHYKQRHDLRHFHNGQWWVYNAINSTKDFPDWCQQFPFWSAPTIRRTFDRLRKRGILLHDNYNLAGYDRTGWYTIDYSHLDDLISQAEETQDGPFDHFDQMDLVNLTKCIGSECTNGSDQSDQMDLIKLIKPIPETTRDKPLVDIIWAQALDELKLQMTKSAYSTWMNQAMLTSLTESAPGVYQATITCQNHYVKDWLSHRLSIPIQRTLAGLLQADQVVIEYVTEEKGDE